MSQMDLSKMNSIPVIWLFSKLNGKVFNNFLKPEKKSDTILNLIFAEHTEIQEVWEGVSLGYMGSFKDGEGPF